MIIDKCSQCDCNKAQPIVNKHFYLCEKRNRIRLDSKKQPKQEKIQASELKKKYSINKLSPTKRIKCHDGQVVTRAELNKKLYLVYNKIDQEREHFCQGCGRNLPLSHSHIISRDLRQDLITDEQNIQLHCFGSYNNCHEKWSRWIADEVINMLDFERNLIYIEKVDQKLFQKMMVKLEYDLKSI